MNDQYHLSISGQRLEGLTEAEVQRRLGADPEGVDEALVWADGWPSWKPASVAFGTRAGAPKWMLGSRLVEATESGAFVPIAALVLLRTIAVLICIAQLVAWIAMWQDASKGADNAVVAALPIQIVGPLAVALAANVLWVRGGRAHKVTGSFVRARVGMEVVSAWGETTAILGLGFWISVFASSLLGGILDVGAPVSAFGELKGVVFLLFFVGAIFVAHILRDLIAAITGSATALDARPGGDPS